MRCIALIQHGPNWVRGKDVYRQGPVIGQHLAAMRGRYDEGSLLIGGPFHSGSGGVAVLDVEDESEARRIMDSDPAVLAGVMTYRLESVVCYFDAHTGTRTASTADELASERERARPTDRGEVS